MMQADERDKVVSEGKRNLWIFVRNGKKMDLFLDSYGVIHDGKKLCGCCFR